MGFAWMALGVVTVRCSGAHGFYSAPLDKRNTAIYIYIYIYILDATVGAKAPTFAIYNYIVYSIKYI